MFKGGLKFFLFIAFIEHIILILAFAMAIYSKPQEMEEFEQPIEVAIIRLPELPRVVNLPQEQSRSVQKVTLNTPERIPKFQGYDLINKALGAVEGNREFRTKPRSPALELNPDRFPLEYTRSQRAIEGIEHGAITDLKFKRIPSTEKDVIPPPGRSDEGKDPRAGLTPSTPQPPPFQPFLPPPPSQGFKYRIEGEVRGRRLIHEPPFPEVSGNEVGEVVLRFWVSPQGDVYKVQCKKKAGDPKLERIARNWVKRLKFAPLSKHVEQKPQWGEITITFSRKK